MSRRLFLWLVLSHATVAALAWIAAMGAESRIPEPIDFGGPISVYYEHPPAKALRPYNVVIDGRSRNVAPPPPSPPVGVWTVSLDNGRVRIVCTEGDLPPQ